MNIQAFSRVNPKIKIGSDCIYMNISGILEYKNALSLALTYTNYDFIYNADYYTSFIDPKPAEEYISKDNELMIIGSLDSVYHNACLTYIGDIQKEFNMYTEELLDISYGIDWKMLKREYFSKDTPVILSCDHYYVYEEYRKNTSDTLHYHSGAHSNTLIDVDIEAGKAYVIDKFFAFVGAVSIESYHSAVMSSYLSKPRALYIKINDSDTMTEEERIRYYLKKVIDNSLKEEAEIDGVKYYKNLKALEMYIDNYEKHLIQLMELKGKYAPQFTTKLLKTVRQNKAGFGNLISYINIVLDDREIADLECLCQANVKLWTRIDQLCDKCYLSGQQIIEYCDKFINIFKTIYEQDKLIFEKLEHLKEKL